ncbi:UNVERIFIED_CONTAM: hypothetical protein Sradi_2336500 [Sesamum radiatum]|uniref:Retrovirus-related Pol polyprotein from transposon TNT 1-94-like beta-barrel domain-containing protein n=1 Tax=Sesamum radiatum TaxID=300843 RepID=A0AAW2T5P7_SESRA
MEQRRRNGGPSGRAFAVSEEGETSTQGIIRDTEGQFSELIKLEVRRMMQENDEAANANFVDFEDFAGISLSQTYPKFAPFNSWILDSWVTSHIYADLSLFQSLKKLSNKSYINLSDGTRRTVAKVGDIHLSHVIKHTQVLYIPPFKYNALTVKLGLWKL